MRLFVILLSALLILPVMADAKQKKDDDAPLPHNEIKGKAPSNYLALNHLHLPVMVDKNRRFRALDLEVWLLPVDEDNLALARSAKKAIIAGLAEDFSNYDWEAFEDSKKGPEIAKRVVATSVERVSGAKLQDVFVKDLILR